MGGWGVDEDGGADAPTGLEIDNGIRQADWVFALIDAHVGESRPLRLTSDHVLDLNRLAVAGLSDTAGVYRAHDDLEITGSRHVPPPSRDVPRLVNEMCEVLDAEAAWDPLDRSAFVLWRINWIHPFDDGNGRTARAASFVVLCTAMGTRLPGQRTLMERMRDDKRAYYNCLREADDGWRKAKPVLRLANLKLFIRKHVRGQIDGAERGE